MAEQNSASYNGQDTTTAGNWTGQYGSDGYQIASLPAVNPSYGSVNIAASSYVFASNATTRAALSACFRSL